MSIKANTITPIVEGSIDKNAVIDSDNSTSYVKLKELGMNHNPEIIPKDKVNEMLPWMHIAISNAKRLLLDIYHDIEPQYLQIYINEYWYKFNRRNFGDKLFDRLLIACVTYKNES